jgi:hypothetical protein
MTDEEIRIKGGHPNNGKTKYHVDNVRPNRDRRPPPKGTFPPTDNYMLHSISSELAAFARQQERALERARWQRK